jgi:LPXTG-motif cell wall-anchored protein
MDFLNNWYIMFGMIFAILALIGLLIFLRSRPKD